MKSKNWLKNINKLKHKFIQLVKYFFILPVRLYQILISPLLGPRCRFCPSCSDYFILAIEKKGLFKGIILGIYRILRCHPFSKGGFDPVK